MAIAPFAMAWPMYACPSACSPRTATNSAPGVTARESMVIAVIRRVVSPLTCVLAGNRSKSAASSIARSAMRFRCRRFDRQDARMQHGGARDFRKCGRCDHAAVVGTYGMLDFHVDH